MKNQRRTERMFDYVVLGALVFIFVAILEVMSRANIKPEVLTVLGASLGVDLGAIVGAASHLWGAPKKQPDAEGRAPSPVEPVTHATAPVTAP